MPKGYRDRKYIAYIYLTLLTKSRSTQVKPVVDTFKEHGVQTKPLNVIMYSSTVLCEILDIVLNMKDP